MKQYKGFKTELDPSDAQRHSLVCHAGVRRFAYNWSLCRREERFNTQEGKERFTSGIDEYKALCAVKKTEFPWMYDVSKYAAQEGLRDCDRAFKNFWEGRKTHGVKWPKRKKKYHRDSFTLYGNPGQIRLQDRYVVLPFLGPIRLKEKGLLKKFKGGKIKSVTISRTADKWFIAFRLEYGLPDPAPLPAEESHIATLAPRASGVDLGLTTFATVSQDGVISKHKAPNPLRKAQRQLARAQRALSRKTKGSRNRKKARIKVARIHARVVNVRKDFVHKFTTSLAKTKLTIVMEDLNVRGMMKNRHLAKAISDQGWYETRRQVEYKVAWQGGRVVVANRWFASTKTCSHCVAKNPHLSLKDREWTCPTCGSTHDRDGNAARNLENLAYREDLGSGASSRDACGGAHCAFEHVVKGVHGSEEAGSDLHGSNIS